MVRKDAGTDGDGNARAGRREGGAAPDGSARAGRAPDRRAVRSRRAIMAAFERLVMERPISQITVSAIAREADVDRKTFYQHFGSIDGVLDEMARAMVERVLDSVERTRAGSEVDALCDERAFEAFFSALATALSEDLSLNRRLLESVPPERLLGYLADHLARGIRERGLASAEIDEGTFDLCLAFELGGIVAALRTWSLGGAEAPALGEVTRVMQRLASTGIRGLADPAPGA